MHHGISRPGRRLLAAVLLGSLALAAGGLATAGAAGRQMLTLALHGQIVGPASIVGTWQATGAIDDGGSYTETFRFSHDGSFVRAEKVLVGAAGTIVVEAHAHVVYQSRTHATFTGGSWHVEFGTGAYALLQARGRPAVTADSFADLTTNQAEITHVGHVVG
jgi:hypothetical protein